MRMRMRIRMRMILRMRRILKNTIPIPLLSEEEELRGAHAPLPPSSPQKEKLEKILKNETR